MSSMRRQHSGEFKATVALAAIRGDKTVNELATEYGVHQGDRILNFQQ